MKSNKTRAGLDVFLNFLMVMALHPLLTIPATIEPSFVGLVYLSSSKQTISTLENISATFTLTPLVDNDIPTMTTVVRPMVPSWPPWKPPGPPCCFLVTTSSYVPDKPLTSNPYRNPDWFGPLRYNLIIARSKFASAHRTNWYQNTTWGVLSSSCQAFCPQTEHNQPTTQDCLVPICCATILGQLLILLPTLNTFFSR